MRRCIPLLLILGLLVMVLGCKADPATQQTLDPAQAQYVEKRGDNSVYGYTFINTDAGDKLTCAGLPVSLIPASSYAQAIMKKAYGSTDKGYSDKETAIDDLDPLFDRYRRESTCNRYGEFRFIDVPDGDYFVVALMNLDAAMEESGYSREHSRGHTNRRDDYREHRDHRYTNTAPAPIPNYGEMLPEPQPPLPQEKPWPSRQEHPYRDGRRYQGSLMERVCVENGESARLTLTR